MRKIIVRSTIYINKFAIYKSIKHIKIYIESLILNIINNKLKRKKIKKTTKYRFIYYIVRKQKIIKTIILII